MKRVFGLCLAAAVLWAAPASARGLHICNKTSQVLWLATAKAAPWALSRPQEGCEIGEDTCALTRGWWKIEPGRCATTTGEDLAWTNSSGFSARYYYYAHDASGREWDGKGGNGQARPGAEPLCVGAGEFSFDTEASLHCDRANEKLFYEVPLRGQSDYTSNLIEGPRASTAPPRGATGAQGRSSGCVFESPRPGGGC
jgi:uncharacterized membrane protein